MNNGMHASGSAPLTPLQAQFRFARQVQRFGVAVTLLLASSLLFSPDGAQVWPQCVLIGSGLVAAAGGFVRTRRLLAPLSDDARAQLTAEAAAADPEDVGPMEVHLTDAPARRFVVLAVGGSVLVFVGLALLMQVLG